MKVFAFAASLRKGSLNKKLIAKVVQILQQKTSMKLEVDHADFREFEMPVYDGDLETSSGIPSGAKDLARRISQADALIISTPEYNGGIPGPLKNALDWVSRTTPMPLSGKPLLLIGASPGALGAVRSLWHSRVPFEAIGTLVHPEMFGLSHAHQAFNESGDWTDAKNQQRLEKLLQTYLQYAQAIRTGSPEGPNL